MIGINSSSPFKIQTLGYYLANLKQGSQKFQQILEKNYKSILQSYSGLNNESAANFLKNNSLYLQCCRYGLEQLVSDLKTLKLERFARRLQIIFKSINFLLNHAGLRWQATEQKIKQIQFFNRSIQKTSPQQVQTFLQFKRVNFKYFQEMLTAKDGKKDRSQYYSEKEAFRFQNQQLEQKIERSYQQHQNQYNFFKILIDNALRNRQIINIRKNKTGDILEQALGNLLLSESEMSYLSIGSQELNKMLNQSCFDSAFDDIKVNLSNSLRQLVPKISYSLLTSQFKTIMKKKQEKMVNKQIQTRDRKRYLEEQVNKLREEVNNYRKNQSMIQKTCHTLTQKLKLNQNNLEKKEIQHTQTIIQLAKQENKLRVLQEKMSNKEQQIILMREIAQEKENTIYDLRANIYNLQNKLAIYSGIENVPPITKSISIQVKIIGYKVNIATNTDSNFINHFEYIKKKVIEYELKIEGLNKKLKRSQHQMNNSLNRTYNQNKRRTQGQNKIRKKTTQDQILKTIPHQKQKPKKSHKILTNSQVIRIKNKNPKYQTELIIDHQPKEKNLKFIFENRQSVEQSKQKQVILSQPQISNLTQFQDKRQYISLKGQIKSEFISQVQKQDEDNDQKNNQHKIAQICQKQTKNQKQIKEYISQISINSILEIKQQSKQISIVTQKQNQPSLNCQSIQQQDPKQQSKFQERNFPSTFNQNETDQNYKTFNGKSEQIEINQQMQQNKLTRKFSKQFQTKSDKFMQSRQKHVTFKNSDKNKSEEKKQIIQLNRQMLKKINISTTKKKQIQDENKSKDNQKSMYSNSIKLQYQQQSLKIQQEQLQNLFKAIRLKAKELIQTGRFSMIMKLVYNKIQSQQNQKEIDRDEQYQLKKIQIDKESNKECNKIANNKVNKEINKEIHTQIKTHERRSSQSSLLQFKHKLEKSRQIKTRSDEMIEGRSIFKHQKQSKNLVTKTQQLQKGQKQATSERLKSSNTISEKEQKELHKEKKINSTQIRLQHLPRKSITKQKVDEISLIDDTKIRQLNRQKNNQCFNSTKLPHFFQFKEISAKNKHPNSSREQQKYQHSKTLSTESLQMHLQLSSFRISTSPQKMLRKLQPRSKLDFVFQDLQIFGGAEKAYDFQRGKYNIAKYSESETQQAQSYVVLITKLFQSLNRVNSGKALSIKNFIKFPYQSVTGMKVFDSSSITHQQLLKFAQFILKHHKGQSLKPFFFKIGINPEEINAI